MYASNTGRGKGFFKDTQISRDWAQSYAHTTSQQVNITTESREWSENQHQCTKEFTNYFNHPTNHFNSLLIKMINRAVVIKEVIDQTLSNTCKWTLNDSLWHNGHLPINRTGFQPVFPQQKHRDYYDHTRLAEARPLEPSLCLSSELATASKQLHVQKRSSTNRLLADYKLLDMLVV